MTAFRFFRSERGFSMIEVLVTLVLISIGVLGMVAMQARTISYTHDSVQRNNAAQLAEDLLEILRSELVEVVDANGIPLDNSPYLKKSADSFPTPQVNCGSQIKEAKDRLGCWAERAKATLPDANNLLSEFHICRTNGQTSCSGTGAAIEIQVAWRVREGECLDANATENSDPTICRYIVRTEI